MQFRGRIVLTNTLLKSDFELLAHLSGVSLRNESCGLAPVLILLLLLQSSGKQRLEYSVLSSDFTH